MKIRKHWTLLSGLLVMLAATEAIAAETPRQFESTVARLGWLAGHWAGEVDGMASEEHWTGVDGNGMVGMHKDVKGGRMVSFEFLRIEATTNGGMTYVASPGGAAPTSFRLKEIGEASVTFESLEHDFPQRILYWIDESKRLHARVEGLMKGETISEEWTWTRVSR